MKKIYTLIAVLYSLSATAQLIPNANFINPVTMPCSVDTTVSLQTFAEWEAYQTLNDEWDGPIDSSHCFDLYNAVLGLNATIDFNQADPNKIVFMRHRFNSTNQIVLPSNGLFKTIFGGRPSPTFVVDTTKSCNGSYCSALITVVQIPDSSGSGINHRVYQTPIDFNGSNNLTVTEFCFTSEYFTNGNYISDLIFKLKPVGNPVNEFYRILFFDIQTAPLFSVNYISDSLSLLPYNSSQFSYDFNWGFNGVDFVLLHDTTYPAANNITSHDVYPIPNTSVQSTVDINFNFPSTFNPQPFTDFRGGFVDGDTIRHNYNLNLFGGSICMNPIVELAFWEASKFVYHSGEVNFSGSRSCMAFGRGGTLKIADNAFMDYGNKGIGMMLLKTGSTLEIGKNATLNFQGTMIMYEFANDPPSQIYMTLNKGSKLKFAYGSHITNKYSKDGTMLLNVMMNGGDLDVSGLPENERWLVNKIYKTPDSNDENNFVIYDSGNNQLQFIYISAKATTINFEVLGTDGKLIKSTPVHVDQGVNYLNATLETLANGLYLASTRSEEKTIVKKFIKSFH